MDKIDLGVQGYVYPMPVTLVGADIDTGPTFKTVAWVTRVEPDPSRLVVALNKRHATTAGVLRHGEFSVCTPSTDMVAVTDWCGIRSAHKGVDKAAPFTVFRGSLEHAPMVEECPLCLECRIFTTVDLGSHELVIGDIAGSWTEECFLTDGKPDIEKLRPFTLTMPDNRYWAVGANVGDAWSAGRGYQP